MNSTTRGKAPKHLLFALVAATSVAAAFCNPAFATAPAGAQTVGDMPCLTTALKQGWMPA